MLATDVVIGVIGRSWSWAPRQDIAKLTLLALTVAWHLLHMGGILVKRYSLVLARSTFTDADRALPPFSSFLLRVIFFFNFLCLLPCNEQCKPLPDCPVLPSACLCFILLAFLSVFNKLSLYFRERQLEDDRTIILSAFIALSRCVIRICQCSLYLYI